MMLRAVVSGVIVSMLLLGCTSIPARSVDTQKLKGMDIDLAIAEVTQKGFSCGKKRSSKPVNSNEISGDVGCSRKSAAVFCPVSQDLGIIFDLATNKITWAGVFERQHCF